MSSASSIPEIPFVDPITSEQNAKQDKRPFATVQAYLFAATLRGIMTIKDETKNKSVIHYNRLKEEVEKLKKIKGATGNVLCYVQETFKPEMDTEVETETEIETETIHTEQQQQRVNHIEINEEDHEWE